MGFVDLQARRAYLGSLKSGLLQQLLCEHHAYGVFRARTAADCEYSAHQVMARVDRESWEVRKSLPTVDASRLIAHWHRRSHGIRTGQSIETDECAARAVDLCAEVIGSIALDVRTNVRGAIQDAIMDSGLLRVSGAQTATVNRCVAECIEEIELALFSLWRSKRAHFATLREELAGGQ